MDNGVKERIEKLKKLKKYETDAEVISDIYHFKAGRGEIKKIGDFNYVKNNKGSFSQCFNGTRKFKPEDYLAIEYVLNTSMAYIIEGKGEISNGFIPKGIRYAAYTDTIGAYEELMTENISNSSDEYNKTLIDYMIEFKSKNGFKYYAERDMLPVGPTGGYKYNSETLICPVCDKKKLLQALCELLPIDLLINYFNGFLGYYEIPFQHITQDQNTSFTDEVISEAIKREDLRKALATSKKINLDSFNKGARRIDGKPYGEGMFVNYGLTVMIKYALTHDVDDEIRTDLIENAIKVNSESFEFVSTFAEEELTINKYGYITNRNESLYFGSIAVPSDPTIELSKQTARLLEELNKQINDYHKLISSLSKISIFGNVVLANKKDNKEYYNFFKLMNSKGVDIVPTYKDSESNNKDSFEVSKSGESRISNGTDSDLIEVAKAIRKLDDISKEALSGKTYYLEDPSFYMYGQHVNYVMPKDISVSNKYKNLVRFIIFNGMWYFREVRNTIRIKRFIELIKAYGISKDELEDFINSFGAISRELVESMDKTTGSGKDFAFLILEYISFIDIYHNDITRDF